MDDIVQARPDIERARSLLGTVKTRMEVINLLFANDSEKFSSKIAEEYYEALFELITAIMCIDGYKTRSDLPGAHLATLNYLRKNYTELTEEEITLLNDLREKRNGIKYYGRNVKIDYLDLRLKLIKALLAKLENILQRKLT